MRKEKRIKNGNQRDPVSNIHKTMKWEKKSKWLPPFSWWFLFFVFQLLFGYFCISVSNSLCEHDFWSHTIVHYYTFWFHQTDSVFWNWGIYYEATFHCWGIGNTLVDYRNKRHNFVWSFSITTQRKAFRSFNLSYRMNYTHVCSNKKTEKPKNGKKSRSGKWAKNKETHFEFQTDKNGIKFWAFSDLFVPFVLSWIKSMWNRKKWWKWKKKNRKNRNVENRIRKWTNIVKSEEDSILFWNLHGQRQTNKNW